MANKKRSTRHNGALCPVNPRRAGTPGQGRNQKRVFGASFLAGSLLGYISHGTKVWLHFLGVRYMPIKEMSDILRTDAPKLRTGGKRP